MKIRGRIRLCGHSQCLDDEAFLFSLRRGDVRIDNGRGSRLFPPRANPVFLPAAMHDRPGMSATTAAFPGSSHYGAFRTMVEVM
jgi:hypothetical protein